MVKLKELRLSKQLSQSELANLLGCNQTAVGKYERGQLEPNIETLKKLSTIFEVSVGYLIGNEDDFGNITVSPGQLTDQLTTQEKELLDAFNLLGPFERDGILVQVKALAKMKNKNLIKK